MRVNVIKRTPFESKTYSYVNKIETRGDSVVLTMHYPDEDEFTMTYDRHEVVLNVNTRED